jgi:hypothetical protein
MGAHAHLPRLRLDPRINAPHAKARAVDITVTTWASVRASKIAFRLILRIGGFGYPFGNETGRFVRPKPNGDRVHRGKPRPQPKCDTPQAILGATPISPCGMWGGAARCTEPYQLMGTHALENMRYSRECSAQHSCQRQRNARLAHILRLRPTPDRDRSTALCRGTARHRVEGHGLRTRLDYNRSVPFGVFLGTLAIDESRCEAFTRCSICVVAFPRLSSSATASSTTSTSSTKCPNLVPSFQTDQTAPANQDLLRHNRERS